MVGIVIMNYFDSYGYLMYWYVCWYGFFVVNLFGLYDFYGGDLGQDGIVCFEEGDLLKFKYCVLIYLGDYEEGKVGWYFEEYVKD